MADGVVDPKGRLHLVRVAADARVRSGFQSPLSDIADVLPINCR